MLRISPNTNGVAINQTWSNNGHNCGLVNKFIWIFFFQISLLQWLMWIGKDYMGF